MLNIPKLTGHNESSPKRKFIVLSAYINKLKRSHTNNLRAHLKALKQKKQGTLKEQKAGNNQTED